MFNSLEDIKSVAVVGASSNSKKLGHLIVKNLIDFKYKGSIYPINLNAESVLNIRGYKSILDVTDKIDLVVIAIPSLAVKDIVEECVKKYVPLISIISSGFKEIGDDGISLEKEIYNLIKDSNTRIIGPNSLGIINTKSGLNASFAPNPLKESSPISFISQSGAIGTAFIDWCKLNNLGFDNFISIGNKLDLDENYFLENIKNQKLIACYLEDIKDGKKLINIGRIHNRVRPVIILKPGKSQEGIKAISSHTGALSTDYEIMSTALSEYGYIQVNNLGEMFNKIKGFSWEPIPKDGNIAIITNAGGPSVVATDYLIEKGLKLAEIGLKTQKSLKEILPRSSNIHNPIDIIGDALSDRYKNAMKLLLEEDSVSSLLVILTPQIMTEIEKTAEYISEMKSYGKTIVASFIGGELTEKGLEILSKHNIAAYHFPETAIDVLSSLVKYSQFLKTKDVPLLKDHFSPYYPDVHSFVTEGYLKSKKDNVKILEEKTSEKIASQYGLRVPDSENVNSYEEALEKANATGYPVVLKISSPNLIHKTDIGGVVLDIKSENSLKEEYNNLNQIIQKEGIQNANIQIQKYIYSDYSIFIGAKKDNNFGSVILFGTGGIYTEVYKDIAKRILPISDDEIENMIKETKIYTILSGTRGMKPVDIKKVVAAIKSVIYIITDYDFITAVDINPLFVDNGEIVSLDIKIYI